MVDLPDQTPFPFLAVSEFLLFLNVSVFLSRSSHRPRAHQKKKKKNSLCIAVPLERFCLNKNQDDGQSLVPPSPLVAKSQCLKSEP